MSVAILFLLCAAGLIWLAVRQARALTNGEWLRASGTRLRIGTPPGREAATVSLERDGTVLHGPLPAQWDLPTAVARMLLNGPGGDAAMLARGGAWRVLAAVDLAGDDPLGTGDAALTAALHDAFGHTAIVLVPEGRDGLPVLLHGLPKSARGSAGGVGVEQSRLDTLLQVTGDPAGLLVEIERRRIWRGGWGTRQAALAAR